MKVIIVGVGQREEAIRKVIEANQELGCEVILVEDNENFTAEFTEVIKPLNISAYQAVDNFPRPKSKYHK